MYNLIIYKVITNPYFRIVRVADGAIMTTLTGALSKTTTWATTWTGLSKITVIGGMPLTIPEDLEPGDYDLLIYDDGTPDNTDAPAFGYRIAWSGKQILGLPMELTNVYV